MPPIDVYRVGGHVLRCPYRRAPGSRSPSRWRETTIDAYVTEVKHHSASPSTSAPAATPSCARATSGCSSARVPLPPSARGAKIEVSPTRGCTPSSANASRHGGFATSSTRSGESATASRSPSRWFNEEYTPVVRMLRDAYLPLSGTEAEAYMRFVAAERYRPTLTHEWSDEVIQRLQRAQLGPAAEAVTSQPKGAVSMLSRGRRRRASAGCLPTVVPRRPP